MTQYSATVDTAHDLIQIQQDRAANYRRVLLAPSHLTEGAKYMLDEIGRQADQFHKELAESLAQVDGHAGDFYLGRVYTTWSNKRVPIDGQEDKPVLASCEADLNALLAAYRAALGPEIPLTPMLRKYASKQSMEITSLLGNVENFTLTGAWRAGSAGD